MDKTQEAMRAALREVLAESFEVRLEQSAAAAARVAGREAAREAIHTTLTSLGIDVADPTHTQADMAYLRKMRLGSEFVTRRVTAGVVSVLVGSTLWMLWEAFKQIAHKG